MEITYDYYRVFYYVCRFRSFTKAAEVLGSCQPNITRTMNNLETQLGVRLFVRSKKGIALTTEGERLFERVGKAFEQIHLAEQELEATRTGRAGVVTIGVSEIAMHEILLPVLSGFSQAYPQIAIRITNESTPSAVASLLEGRVDFALVTSPVSESREYSCRAVKAFREFPVAKRGSTGQETLTRLEDIAARPLIMLAEGTGTRAYYEEVFAKRGILLAPQMIAATEDQVLAMAKSGLGIGFVPESMITEEVTILPLEEELPARNICLLQSEKREIGNAARLLIGYIGRFMEQRQAPLRSLGDSPSA